MQTFLLETLLHNELRGPDSGDANLRDPQKGMSGLVAKCLEEALLLPEDMQELKFF